MFTRKSLDYLDFKKFDFLKKNKHYLTEAGFKEMTFIAMNMNSGRDILVIPEENLNKKKT